jgi:hypothetical protein
MVDRWSALSRELSAAVEQVLRFLEETPDFEVVQSAVLKTMSGEQVAAEPKWTRSICRDPEILYRAGGALDDTFLTPALGKRVSKLTPRIKGLAGMAVALCRNQDTISTLAEKLPKEDARLMVRMARLAQATVGPGEPSTMRGRLRALLGELEGGRDN